MTDVYSIPAREAVIVDIPIPFADAGTHHGIIRARLHDDETDEWFFQCSVSIDHRTRHDDYPVEWCRRPDLDDFTYMMPEWMIDKVKAGEWVL